MWKKYLKQLSMPESYISITLGFLVVIVAGLLIYNYFTAKDKISEQVATKESVEEIKKTDEAGNLPLRHTVAQKETLWSIAEKYYKSGYNWVSIVKENNLRNADIIQVGQELIIPKADIIKPVSGTISASATEPEKTYTVIKGDNLWNISVREYGDGFSWPKIAKTNNLVNPNLIHPGNLLKLPR